MKAVENYNTGYSLNVGEISDCFKAAKDFSEGNKELEELLLNCFSMGVETLACCKGHLDRAQKPYISFRYCIENLQVIYAIISRLKDRNVEFRYTKCSGHSQFRFCFDKYSEASELFSEINTAMKEFKIGINYFAALPECFQKYVSLVKCAENDEDLEVSVEDTSTFFQFGCGYEDGRYQYFLITSDSAYAFLAQESGFQKQANVFYPAFILDVSCKENGSDNLSKFVSILPGSPIIFPSRYVDNVNVDNNGQLEVLVGDSIVDVAAKLIKCKNDGKSIFAVVNGIRIDNNSSNTIEEIVDYYFYLIELKRSTHCKKFCGGSFKGTSRPR